MIHAPSIRRMAASDSYVFLMKELEKVDEKILEPLTSTDWPRDMPVVTGGGLIESIATIDVSYASTGLEDDNLYTDPANDIPVIQADFSKQVARTFNFAEYMSVSITEKEKMMNIGRDPMTFLNKGIHLHCDKVMDRNVYVGFSKVSSSGLCNNATIIRSSAAMNAGNTSTQWKDKTADEILMDINAALTAVWEENDCSSDALPNHILIPTEQFGQLVTRKVSDDSGKSILTYVLENNIVADDGTTWEDVAGITISGGDTPNVAIKGNTIVDGALTADSLAIGNTGYGIDTTGAASLNGIVVAGDKSISSTTATTGGSSYELSAANGLSLNSGSNSTTVTAAGVETPVVTTPKVVLSGSELNAVSTTGSTINIAEGTEKPSVTSAEGADKTVATQAAVDDSANKILDYAYGVFAAKQQWMDENLGINSGAANPYSTAFANTEYVKNATTMTGAIATLDDQISKRTVSKHRG